MAITLIFIPTKIPYGNPIGHAGGLDQEGNPVPNQWMVRQARRDRLLRLALLAVAVGRLIDPILKKLGL